MNSNVNGVGAVQGLTGINSQFGKTLDSFKEKIGQLAQELGVDSNKLTKAISDIKSAEQNGQNLEIAKIMQFLLQVLMNAFTKNQQSDEDEKDLSAQPAGASGGAAPQQPAAGGPLATSAADAGANDSEDPLNQLLNMLRKAGVSEKTIQQLASALNNMRGELTSQAEGTGAFATAKPAS
jgi:hypothetical protein